MSVGAQHQYFAIGVKMARAGSGLTFLAEIAQDYLSIHRNFYRKL